jgi:predicted  nucleic acid-binding Zn-ribbon protein
MKHNFKLYEKLEAAEKKMIRAQKAWLKIRTQVRRLEKRLDKECLATSQDEEGKPQTGQ